MRAYRLSIDHPDSDSSSAELSEFGNAYHTTRNGAHEAARALPPHQREFAYIDLIEFATDQATVVEMLNGNHSIGTILRSWKLAQRGGLKETPVEP
jgi:hypothetical protein